MKGGLASTVPKPAMPPPPPGVLGRVLGPGGPLHGYRAPPEKLAALASALAGYRGTHNFHNFTSRRAATDKSCHRYIMSFDTGEPWVDDHGTEWVCLTVLGQSFLLNQIRKLVALAVQVARGAQTRGAVRTALSKKKHCLPMAPGDGLYLDSLFFDAYNKNLAKDKNTNKSEGSRVLLLWDQGALLEEIKDFKEKQIANHIIAKEKESRPFLKWLNYLRVYPTKIKEEEEKKCLG
mmetsp:Transcript_41753/g.65331  ORF Transcript_41753/g.65331 Transcript_41753/m.65331 type:complete len:235 (-) Transcript_41753:215-919(-)